MEGLSPINEAVADPRGMLKRKIGEFKGRWYLDHVWEKALFLWGFFTAIYFSFKLLNYLLA